MSRANERNATALIKAEAELAAARPLLEAAGRAYKKRQGGYGLDMSEVQEAAILYGYNAYREGEEGKP
jgi:hypothetical protein